MGFFSDLKEDLSQAVSEFSGEEKAKDKEKDLFAAAEESMGIDYAEEESVEPAIEEALDSFLDQVAANAEDAEAQYDNQETKEEADYSYQEQSYTYKPDAAIINSTAYVPEKKTEEQQVTDEVAIITTNMIVNGDMLSTGSLDVMGVVNGNIQVYGELNVTGEINGNTTASNIVATNCKITGDLTSSGAIKIGGKAVIRGNVYATSAVISGAVKGDIDVHGPVILDSTAIVMGDIKSKSVQINNGAAIEGMCSQCYAEVSPSAFFRD